MVLPCDITMVVPPYTFYKESFSVQLYKCLMLIQILCISGIVAIYNIA